MRIEAVAAEGEALCLQQAGELGGVGPGVLDHRVERGMGRGGDLDLAARLDGDQRAVCQGGVGRGGVQGRGAVVPQRHAQSRDVHRPRRVLEVMQRPLQLDAVQPWGSVLEADHRDVALGLLAVSQRRRRLFGVRCSAARWSDEA